MSSRKSFAVAELYLAIMSQEPFEPNEVRVCMMLALCLCGASLTLIYRFMG